MGKKYIIDLNPDCVEGEYLRIPARIAGEEQWLVTKAALTPYTEPDLEQVREEAYQKGYETGYEDGYNEPGKNQQEAYQRGLSDAWEAAKKLWDLKGEMIKAFRKYSVFDILNCYTASEVIEKIRQYEQKKQEKDAEIKVGKEFQMGERKCVVTHIIDGTQRRVLWDNGVSGLVDNTDLFGNLTPTGRYFPEIATVLEKMRGESND